MVEALQAPHEAPRHRWTRVARISVQEDAGTARHRPLRWARFTGGCVMVDLDREFFSFTCSARGISIYSKAVLVTMQQPESGGYRIVQVLPVTLTTLKMLEHVGCCFIENPPEHIIEAV